MRSTARTWKPGTAEDAAAVASSCMACFSAGTSRTRPQRSQTAWEWGFMFGSNRDAPGESESAAQSPADASVAIQ